MVRGSRPLGLHGFLLGTTGVAACPFCANVIPKFDEPYSNPQAVLKVLEPLSTSYLRFMMLHSCRAAPFLVAVLLGAYPASAVRTIVKLKECGYNRLNKAKVSDLKDGRVQVKFCEETVVLDSNQSQTDAWKSLMWWDPAQQGKKLTNQDLEILKSYLGQYDYSRPMGQIGHGLLPKNYEGFREDNRRGNDAAMVRAVLNFEVPGQCIACAYCYCCYYYYMICFIIGGSMLNNKGN